MSADRVARAIDELMGMLHMKLSPEGRRRFGEVLVQFAEDMQPKPLPLQACAPVRTLRDEFAMAALTGFASNPGPLVTSAKDGESLPAAAARLSYVVADAMLKARGADEGSNG